MVGVLRRIHDHLRQDTCRGSGPTSGIVESIGLWPDEPGSIKITYVAGYTDDELQGRDTLIDASPIAAAIQHEASLRARAALAAVHRDRLGMIPGPIVSERMGDYTYKLADAVVNQLFGKRSGVTGHTVQLLSEFVNHGIV